MGVTLRTKVYARRGEEDRVDCFFLDDNIDDFIERCAIRINKEA